MYAIEYGRNDIITELIKKYKVDFNAIDSSGNNILIYLIVKNKYNAYINNLLISLLNQNKIYMNCFFSKNWKSPLHYAIEYKEVEICKILIEKGIKLNYVDRNGDTALTLATKYGLSEIVNLIIKKIK